MHDFKFLGFHFLCDAHLLQIKTIPHSITIEYPLITTKFPARFDCITIWRKVLFYCKNVLINALYPYIAWKKNYNVSRLKTKVLNQPFFEILPDCFFQFKNVYLCCIITAFVNYGRDSKKSLWSAKNRKMKLKLCG